MESRVLLSGLQPLPAVPVVPVKLPVGFELPPKTEAPAAYSNKIQSLLWTAIEPVVMNHARQPLAPARTNMAGAVQVQIKIGGVFQTAVNLIKRLGVQVQSQNASLRMVQAWVKPSQVSTIAGLASVRSIGLPIYAQSASGSVQTEGDSLLFADQVRQRFANLGIDGSGVKIGVISDGITNAGLVGADVPSITVNPSLPGSGDEGTAMIEIVHDLAPGAQIFFSGPGTDLDMIDSINWLRSQGCNVIVDDLIFFSEPFFSDGPIAQAAQAAVDAGVVYISAAGNQGVASGFFGDSHYQGFFNNDGVGFHDFDTGQNVDDFKEMLVQNGATLTAALQWSDPFGGSGNDFDLYLMNASFQVIAASTDFQAGSQDPIEAFQWTNTTGADQLVRVLINWFAGDPSRELELFTFGAGTGAFDHNVVNDSIIGHQAAPGVIAVSAIFSGDPGADTIEFFASRGTSTIYTDFNTQTSIARQVLDGAAIDGVQTHIGQLGLFLNPFFGTSAAAPHTAAIVALMLQSNPTLTPAQVTTNLQATADDLTDYGIGYDDVSGAGRFNALRAVFRSVQLPAPDLFADTDSGISDTDNITKFTFVTLTGAAPAGAYVTLFIDGLPDQSTQLGPNQTMYGLTSIAPLFDGTHIFTVRVGPDSSTALADLSADSLPLTITIDTQPVAPPTVDFLFENDQRLRFVLGEEVPNGFSAGDLVVENLTLGGTFPVSLLHAGLATYAFFSGILPNGNYRATLPASAVTDTAGNPMASDVVLNFFVLAGDANRDRRVDLYDLTTLATNWQGTGRTFSQGDFDYNGTVNSNDLGILAANWQTRLDPPAQPAPPVLTSAAPRAPVRTPTRISEGIL